MRGSKYVPVSPWRGQAVVITVATLFGVLVWRVLSLQVLDTDRGYEFLQDQGEARYVRTAEIPAYRGIITDRRGEPLAVSTPVVSLWAHPGRLGDSGRVAELATALGMGEAALRKRLVRHRGRSFMYLKRHATPAVAQTVQDLDIPGVHGEREYQRYYPAGEVTAHLVGITNIDGEGIEGLELAFDGWLRSTPGRKRVIKDIRGNVVRDIGELQPAVPGRDLRLAIDLRLQYLAYLELQRAATVSGARAGTVVTLDSRTGEILALVNFPTYNPNSRSGLRADQIRNRALTDLFEPGSTMKPLTLVAALESGLFTPDTRINTSPGRVKVGDKVLLDPVDYGEISVAQVIAKSSQVGIVKMALQLDEQAVWNTFRQFGLGEGPGTGFPGESPGLLPHRDRWHPLERVTMAYGYGLAVTPLQLVRAYGVIASGGRLLTPRLQALDTAGGRVFGEKVIESRIAKQVLAVLHGVTRAGGTAQRARISGYTVAGKTGTAHKASRDGYADDRYLAYFVGIVPVTEPRLVTVVLLDEPQGDRYYGGEVAAPVFAKISSSALRLLNVASDKKIAGVAP